MHLGLSACPLDRDLNFSPISAVSLDVVIGRPSFHSIGHHNLYAVERRVGPFLTALKEVYTRVSLNRLAVLPGRMRLTSTYTCISTDITFPAQPSVMGIPRVWMMLVLPIPHLINLE